jgi:hypothetical protein
MADLSMLSRPILGSYVREHHQNMWIKLIVIQSSINKSDQETFASQRSSKSTDQERWSDFFGVSVERKCVISAVVGKTGCALVVLGLKMRMRRDIE